MNKYHPQFIKSIKYMLSKIDKDSTEFNYKLSEIAAMCIMPVLDVYELAQDYYKIDLSAKINKIKEFYD